MREDAVTNKRGLVFARVGRGSLHRSWLEGVGTERDWDLQLSTFERDFDDASGDFPLSRDEGTKWDSVARHFRANMDLLDKYDYVLFPDDDLLFDRGGFDEIFRICRDYSLLIAQPALTPTSHYSHPLLLAAPRFRLRFVSFIEPMCPCIETGYLKSILWCFERWMSGWGQDFIWTHLMDEPFERAAVIDAVQMTHTRPRGGGVIYDQFKKLGVDWEAEQLSIRESFDEVPNVMIYYGGVLKNGIRTGRVPTQILSGLHLLRSSSSTRSPELTTRAGLGLIKKCVTQIGYSPHQIHYLADSLSMRSNGQAFQNQHGSPRG